MVKTAVAPGRSIPDNLLAAYQALQQEAIVADEELRLLDAWLEDTSAQ